MSADEMKAIIRQWVEDVWNGGNLSRADELMAPDYVLHMQSGTETLRGPDGFKGLCATYRTAFPDIHISIDDLMTDGDRCVWRFTTTGTHRGPLFGMPPSGKTINIGGVVISRFAADGTWVEDWPNWDIIGMLQQIGAAPVPAAA